MKKSSVITQTIVRICYLLLPLSIVLLKVVMSLNSLSVYEDLNDGVILIPYALVIPAGLVALVSLDVILGCVKKGEIFTGKISKCLMILVWSCTYAGCVGVVSFAVLDLVYDFFVPFIIILAVGELFMALICYVLKHCFDAGKEIKTENDLTI